MAAIDGIGTQATALGSLNGVSGINGTSAAAAASGAEKKPESVASAAVSDQATVSSTGGLVAAALSTSDVRQDKVASLQAAIASGSYNVSSSDVASKIVDSLLK
jgi:negative regulator of flagellin synthesis FlgM